MFLSYLYFCLEFEILFHIEKASQKKRNICDFKWIICLLFFFICFWVTHWKLALIYICIYIYIYYIYIYYIYIYIYICIYIYTYIIYIYIYISFSTIQLFGCLVNVIMYSKQKRKAWVLADNKICLRVK